MRIAPFALTALPLVLLAACGTVEVGTPQMSPIAYPAPLVPTYQMVGAPPPQPTMYSSASSLWKTGAKAFFKDQRATRVGDILTVNIEIDDSAEVENSTDRSRQNSMSVGVSNLLGLESSLGRVLPGGFDPTKAIGFGGEAEFSGDGTIARAEKISLTMAAVVTHVLPNGNLMIQGRQEVRTNQELRELTVASIVRPEDITASNTIRSEQIAEARISYGGRGAITQTQKTPVGQAVLEQVTPF